MCLFRKNWDTVPRKCHFECGALPKLGVFQLKMVTRIALVAKFGHFSTKNGDEIGLRRQFWAFLN